MRKRLENNLQAEIVRFFNNEYCLKHHKPRCMIFAVQNEMASQIAGAIKAKVPKVLWSIIDKTVQIVVSKAVTFGFKKGVSDLILVIPEKVLFVELKTEIGKQREEQKNFQDIVTSLGFSYYIIRDLESFKKIINKYINIV